MDRTPGQRSAVPADPGHDHPVELTDDEWLDELAERFRRQSESMHPRAPLYVAVCDTIARHRDLRRMLLHAPPTQRLPVMLLAAIHAEVLTHPDEPLSRWYPNVTADAMSPTADRSSLDAELVAFCERHHDEIAGHCRTRFTQTNEIGRCALFVPVFGQIAGEKGPIAHLDVGASAGLTLLWPRYRYDYGMGTTIGADSPVTLTCGTRGEVPVPPRLPPLAASAGLDQEPIDLTDHEQVRWLEACVWPDQSDRFSRLRAAIALAGDHRPRVHAGDAVDDLPVSVAALRAEGHPVVTNSWVLNYLTPQQRTDYVAALDRLGAASDLTWVFLEAPHLVPELPVDAVLADERARVQSVLTVVRWRHGARDVHHAAVCHPHGYWMHWRGQRDTQPD